MIASFLAGLIFGVITILYMLSLFLTDATYSRLIAGATTELFVLEKLKDGDTAIATSILNESLEVNLFALDSYKDELSEFQNKKLAKLLLRTRKIIINPDIQERTQTSKTEP
jgi:hypothetical protein